MTSTSEPVPKNPSAWHWPIEWAVERAFWREVGSRTVVAGVFTLVILGVLGLNFAFSFGLLSLGQVLPILIGIGLFVIVLVAYLVVLRSIRRAERKKFARALADEEPTSGPVPTLDDLMNYSVEQRHHALATYSNATRDSIAAAGKRARLISTLVTISGVIAGAVVSFLVPFLR